MFVFPIIRPDLNRLARIKAFQGQSFERLPRPLVSADQTLYVRFNS